MQGFEHAEAEEVKLHQSGCGAVDLIPLQHRASGGATPLHRADFAHRSVAQHHAGRVNAQVARSVEEFTRKLFNEGTVTSNVLGTQCVGRGVAEGSSDIPARRTGAIRNDVGDLSGVVAAVAAIDVLNHLFATTRFDIDIDIGWAIAGRGEKPFEEEVESHGVSVRNTEGKAGG